MQFSNYNDFRTKVFALIDGDDASASFSTVTLDLMTGMAEQRVYNDLRASTMQADLSVAVASNAAALPSDLIELKEVYFSGEKPLEVIPLDRLRTFESLGQSSGDVRYAALDGDSLRFWPTASGTVLGTYYKRPTSMVDETTWANQTTLARYPELFLYAALCEAAPLIGEDSRIPVWEGKYSQALAAARTNEQWRAYGGSPLRVRAR